MPRTGAVIIASNHIALIDPPVLGASIFREANFAAKVELFRHPLLKMLISYLNAFPVRRDGIDNVALKNSLRTIEAGKVLIIFPEGTRSRSGEMLPFKRGVGYIVARTKAVVLPVYIKGTNALNKCLFKPGGITVRIGEPLWDLAEKFKGEDCFERIAEEVKAAVVRLKNLSN
jgi:1-acyl-sn-glycerol-3-phosphate acyltransferase